MSTLENSYDLDCQRPHGSVKSSFFRADQMPQGHRLHAYNITRGDESSETKVVSRKPGHL